MCQPGRPFAPRARPVRLAGLGGLPEREVERVALAVVGIDAGHGVHLVDVAAGQLAVAREAAHREVHVAVDRVGVAALDEPLDHLDHAGDRLGGLGALGGVLDAERAHRRDERLGVLLGDLGGGAALFVGAVDDLVVDVGDVLDEPDVVALVLEVAADHVERQERPRVADVDVVVDRRAADVHRDLAGLARDELLFGAAQRVVDAHSGPFTDERSCGGGSSDLPDLTVELDRSVGWASLSAPHLVALRSGDGGRRRGATRCSRRSMRRWRQRNISTTGSGRSSWCRSIASTRDPAAHDHATGDADHRAVGRHVVDDHRAAADLAAVADGDVAEHRGADADDDAVLERRMALAGLLAGAAERDALVERHVVADDASSRR